MIKVYTSNTELPENTQFNFEVLMPRHNVFKTEMFRNGNNARFDDFHTYIEVYNQANLSNLQSKIPAFIKKYRGDDKAINAKSELQFRPLLDIYCSPDLMRQGSHRIKIYFFVVVAVFILIVARINYINLATGDGGRTGSRSEGGVGSDA